MLRRGECVAIPTETVYGLAADATRPDSVARIFAWKGRPAFNPLIVHGSSYEALLPYAHFNPLAERLAKAFWPGPLTLVLPKKETIPEIVTAGHATVAVRVPNHPLTLTLLRELDFPLAAPSANRSGRISPTCARDVMDEFEAFPLGILDGGPCSIGLESTVLYVPQEPDRPPKILRPGGVALETLQAFLGQPIDIESTASPEAGYRSPGLLSTHYAPSKPLHLISPEEPHDPPPRAAWIGYGATTPSGYDKIWNLSTAIDSIEAAPRLFQALRAFDRDPTLLVAYAWEWPEEGLGRAINDRLRRASTKKNLP